MFAAPYGRQPLVHISKLADSRTLVGGVAIWCNAAGSCVTGGDTAHRKASLQRAVVKRAAPPKMRLLHG